MKSQEANKIDINQVVLGFGNGLLFLQWTPAETLLTLICKLPQGALSLALQGKWYIKCCIIMGHSKNK